MKQVAEREILLLVGALRSKHSGVQSEIQSVKAQREGWRNLLIVEADKVLANSLDNDVFARF
jgi:hypothetical protein